MTGNNNTQTNRERSTNERMDRSNEIVTAMFYDESNPDKRVELGKGGVRELRFLEYQNERLPKWLGSFAALSSLTISAARNLAAFDGITSNMESLQHLTISDCRGMRTLDDLNRFPNLRTLDIRGCHNLRGLSPELGQLRKLRSLEIEDCRLSATLPPEIGKLNRLREFHMTFCPAITSFPPEFVQIRKLEKIVLDEVAFPLFANLHGLPQLTRLKYLQTTIWSAHFPTKLCDLENLQELSICSIMGGIHIPESVAGLHNLQRLELRCARWSGLFAPLEGDLSNLRSLPKLESVTLFGFDTQTILNFFAKPWQGSRVLRKVDLTFCKLGNEYQRILLGLPSSLADLKLDYNNISHLDGFVTTKLPLDIRRISLAGNRVLMSQNKLERERLEQLARKYARLGGVLPPGVEWSDSKLLTSSTQYRLIFQRSGDSVLNDVISAMSAFSLLPEILERAVGRLLGSGLQRRRKPRVPVYKQSPGGYERHQKRLALEASILYTLLRMHPDRIASW